MFSARAVEVEALIIAVVEVPAVDPGMRRFGAGFMKTQGMCRYRDHEFLYGFLGDSSSDHGHRQRKKAT